MLELVYLEFDGKV